MRGQEQDNQDGSISFNVANHPMRGQEWPWMPDVSAGTPANRPHEGSGGIRAEAVEASRDQPTIPMRGQEMTEGYMAWDTDKPTLPVSGQEMNGRSGSKSA